MKCGRCNDPAYCPCADFFKSWRAYWAGELDHLMTPEQKKRRDDARPRRAA
jgi:hypothetical protein